MVNCTLNQSIAADCRHRIPHSFGVSSISFESSASFHSLTMDTPKNANETYCTFTLPGDMTAGGLPSEADIRKDLEDNDPKVSIFVTLRFLWYW
jgi:hypothetical protein